MRTWLLALLLVAFAEANAQDSLEIPPARFHPSEEWNTRKIASTAAVGAIFASTWVDAYFTWWKDVEKPFSFYSENWFSVAHQGIDKPGHFYGTYAVFKITRDILLWGGHDHSTAFWWATGLSLFNGLQIEIGDGYSPYGFDYQDLIVDFAGVGFGMLQTAVPFLENFNIKVSYWSATGFKTPIEFTKDYDAMTIWLSLNVHNILSTENPSWWPAWLNVAVGYGVDDHETRKEFVIGLDLNLEGFTTHSEDVLLAEKLGNLWHTPAPALKFTTGKEPRWYLLHTR
jgi:hypothetical protein